MIYNYHIKIELYNDYRSIVYSKSKIMKKTVKVFTDGSANNCKKQVAGCGVYFPNSELDNISVELPIEPLTNNRAELYAIFLALHNITKKLEFDKIIVYSDSIYCIKSLTEWIHTWQKNGWRTASNREVLNKDLIAKIYNEFIKKYEIEFVHVNSHTGKKDFKSIGNDMADKLAKAKCIKK